MRNFEGTLKLYRDRKWGCVRIGRAMGMSPGKVYHTLNKYGMIGKVRPNPPAPDFSSTPWQFLIASVCAKGRITFKNGTAHITYTASKNNLPVLLWKVRMINSFGIAGMCRKVWQVKPGWYVAEFHSKRVGAILSKIVDGGEAENIIHHPLAQACLFLDTGKLRCEYKEIEQLILEAKGVSVPPVEVPVSRTLGQILVSA